MYVLNLKSPSRLKCVCVCRKGTHHMNAAPAIVHFTDHVQIVRVAQRCASKRNDGYPKHSLGCPTGRRGRRRALVWRTGINCSEGRDSIMCANQYRIYQWAKVTTFFKNGVYNLLSKTFKFWNKHHSTPLVIDR